jgi:hypothetical protein
MIQSVHLSQLPKNRTTAMRSKSFFISEILKTVSKCAPF